jgi:hypothetical protein
VSFREDLAVRLPRLAARWQDGELDDAAYAAAYFLVWQMAVHGRRFASRSSKSDGRPDAAAWHRELDASSGEALRAALIGWFERYRFLGVIPNVPAAFLGWLREQWSLSLALCIPSPEEVLRMQAAGCRPVTVVAEYPRALRPVLSKADGFAFLVHDLEHAYKFFHDPRLHAGQRRFFRLLRGAVEAGLFQPYRADAVFSGQFDYLISDMNTHPVHSLRYLVAVLIECLLRREGKGMRELLSPGGEAELTGLIRNLGAGWEFPEPAVAALLRLLDGGFGPADAERIERAIFEAPAPGRGGPDSSPACPGAAGAVEAR